MSLLDWLANLSFVIVLAIAVALYVLLAAVTRSGALPEKTRRGLGEFVESVLFAWVVVFLILKPFFLQAFFIPSQSMEPTLAGHNAGEQTGLSAPATYQESVHDRLLVAKFPFWFRGPHRGEILVFKAPPNADKDGIERDYIKRLIGLPGERLEVRAGKVWIDGHALEEPYTMEPSDGDFGPIVVPKDHYFMMGDNRNHSADSRYWGPLQRDRIVGEAWLRFWPLDKIGFLPTPRYDVPEHVQPAIGVVALMH